MRYLHIDAAALERIVTLNTKSRLVIAGDRIRAVQGHSTENMPVTLDALEASWQRYAGSGLLFHGTTTEAVPAIARDGLLPQRRTHVHLAPARDSKVGKRSRTPVVLGISLAKAASRGVSFFEADNGVVLARRVPADCIVSLECTTRAARALEAQLRATFASAGIDLVALPAG